ncbi:MAG: class I SAM-dependent methyltransferase [Bacteroidia bacterium]|jgi:2-polyprenyl-3-methyl-5-hydroxy-6-metoxy-1,4-benzoquinol methylase
MTEITDCPICSSISFSAHLSAVDYTVSNELFAIKRCNTCDFLFTSPRPNLDALPRYYHSEAYISHSDTSKGLVSKLYKIARRFTLNRKYGMVASYCKRNKLLDIGCGTGAFLNHAKSKGLDVLGVEPDDGARAFAIEKYGLSVYDESMLNNLEPSSFGAITLWHVLEHVPNLDERLAQLKRLLHPNGRIFVAVPNPNSFDAKHYRAHWAAYDVPRHLWHFTPQSMHKLLEKNNLHLHGVLPMKLDAFYISLLSEKYKHGRTRYLFAFWNGLKSNLKAGKQGWSSQIYVIGK